MLRRLKTMGESDIFSLFNSILTIGFFILIIVASFQVWIFNTNQLWIILTLGVVMLIWFGQNDMKRKIEELKRENEYKFGKDSP